MKKLFISAFMAISALSVGAQSIEIYSPDGKLHVCTDVVGGVIVYDVQYNGKTILETSPLGFKSNIGDFSTGMTRTGWDEFPVKKDYTQDRVKKSHVSYRANAMRTKYTNATGLKMNVLMQVSNNDLAIRYEIPRKGEPGSIVIFEEATGFTFPSFTTTFMCPQSDAMIGWKRTKPSYEEEYIADAPLSLESKYHHGFTFPCLFHVGDNGWALITETGVDSHYCASHLSDCENGNTFRIAFPMAEENNGNGTPWAAMALPANTPWRTITVGSTLAPIDETTITQDLVDPLYEPSRQYKPGRSTWSWILWQDESINYDDQIAFADLAQAMGYEYMLVDAFWDKNIGRDRIVDLIAYARERGVEVMLWYSSSGYWNDITQSPVNCMDNSIARKREMKWLREIGVRGIKVDFFGGDKQETMRLYEDILSDANEYGIQVIFHGCTLPRGWERMYPNYVGSEAVLASENLIFEQHHCDIEAFSATLHPFIRNSVAAMEYGGSFFNRYLSRKNKKGSLRRTTDVFSLATAVLFQNPVQNFALAPNNLTETSPICLDFMRAVPTTWDDVKYVDGYPGKYVVLARRHGDTWYVAGVNATAEPLALNLDLSTFFGKDKAITIYSDAKDLSPQKSTAKSAKVKITVPTNGGFVVCN